MKDLLEGNQLLHPMEMVSLGLPAVNICGKSISVSQRQTLLRSVDGARIKAIETSVVAWSLISENSIHNSFRTSRRREGPLHTGICSSFELKMSNLQGQEAVKFHLKGWLLRQDHI